MGDRVLYLCGRFLVDDTRLLVVERPMWIYNLSDYWISIRNFVSTFESLGPLSKDHIYVLSLRLQRRDYPWVTSWDTKTPVVHM